MAKRSSTNYGSSSWKDKSKGVATSNAAPIPSKTPPKFHEQSSKKSWDVKCFRCQGLRHYAYECPNKKVMILRDGKYINESEVEKGEESENDKEEVEKTPEEKLLMIRWLLDHQLKSMEESQRENIFHTRCLINGKVCMMIIDGGNVPM